MLLLSPCWSLAARAAEPVTLDFDAYALGIPVAHTAARIDIGPAGYGFQVRYNTTGLVSAIISGAQTAEASGYWSGDGAVPQRFQSDGRFQGAPRHILIDYAQGVPDVRRLEPPDTVEREVVPPAQTRDTIDTLSAMMVLLHRVQAGGRCDGVVRTFDGRRLASVTARTVGPETLPPTARSDFAGPALRCDVVAQPLAGFLRGAGAAAHQPKHGSAWFARLKPGGALWPVRVQLETPWVGETTLYLSSNRS